VIRPEPAEWHPRMPERREAVHNSIAFGSHHGPEVRRRDGAPLQREPAYRVTDRRPAPDGQPIAQG
jgi:hypothetical protein